ncbi:unnamed protein product [Adineta steineri]|uniref:G-protein coupled receptors family 1 profile domain-containing protein n=1 Tax=Adineta steineri TaxID=433720 RepID=A0A820BJQ9_9BILA|nr:unnamed protein product [Adineta steineri]CAF4199828.1 unnamed protein product [Adineta steineri]
MDSTLNFILLLIFQIPAILVSIIIFIYFASDRNARSKPKNHIWLILLILNFLYLVSDLPMSMSYYSLGKIWLANDGYCVWWNWYESSLNTLGLCLMAWASIERHFFIFHSQTIMRVRWKMWMAHYIPIFLCFAWILTFHFIFIVTPPICVNTWYFTVNKCGAPCFYTADNGYYALVEFVVNVVAPLALITFANIFLIIRVIYQKVIHHQAVNWRRHRKMTFQLWLISSVYLAFWLPSTLSTIIQLTIMPTFFVDQYDTMVFIIYFIPLLLPIVCLNTYPELLRKINGIIRRRIARNRIGISTVRTVH